MDKFVKFIYKNRNSKKNEICIKSNNLENEFDILTIKLYTHLVYYKDFFSSVTSDNLNFYFNTEEFRNSCINFCLNRYCNCKAEKIFINDLDAYGQWIYCNKCKIWCGWRDEGDYFDINGKNIYSEITLKEYIQLFLSHQIF